MMTIYDAPAKVNLHLAITDVRDDGYHELDTSFVYVNVGDKLHIKASDQLSVSCSNADFDGERNLVYQVLTAFRVRYNVELGLSIFVEKHLPAQAGLGGGSSDAATALLVANRMWGVGCSVDELIQFAVSFGADIPCFLFQQASQAKGIGECLKPYAGIVPEAHVVLAWPGEGVSTVAAFQHYDLLDQALLTEDYGVARLRDRSCERVFEVGFNDLEESALALCLPLVNMLSMMRDHSDLAWMSGSGSACVAMCSSFVQAEKLVARLESEKLATWTFVGHFVRDHPLRMKEKIGA